MYKDRRRQPSSEMPGIQIFKYKMYNHNQIIGSIIEYPGMSLWAYTYISYKHNHTPYLFYYFIYL